MKGLSELMVIVVSVIVILIAALILISIFGKSIGGVTDASDKVRASGLCGFRCAFLCQTKGTKAGPPEPEWTNEKVKIGDNEELCSKYSPCACDKSLDGTKAEFTK